jgi:cation diffusion facilitator CzcD-associated flavoprotein CzcO
MYTPRDKLADWLEQYVSSQDLIVWTNSRFLPFPSYDFNTKRWTVVIDRNGTHVTLHPVHIVLAAGSLGEPRIPEVLDKHVFRGVSFHASEYHGGRSFAGKQVVVVGAGNTSADICQDLAFHGAYVTMAQRSSTCVVSSASVTESLLRTWPEGVPTDVSDLKMAALPLRLMHKLAVEGAEQSWAREAELHKGLEKAGLKLNKGIGGTGQYFLVLERFGGEEPTSSRCILRTDLSRILWVLELEMFAFCRSLTQFSMLDAPNSSALERSRSNKTQNWTDSLRTV